MSKKAHKNLGYTPTLQKLGFINWLLILAVFVWGTFQFHGIIFRDGFDFIHGDFGDSRLIAICLENSYKYFSSLGQNTSFWSPSWIYYPFKNGMAFSDVMVGGVVFYAPWRLIGFSEMTSYQLWFICTTTANFLAFILLGRYLKFSTLGICIGAFLVSFSMPNMAYVIHPQMITNYYLLLTVLFVKKSFDDQNVKSAIAKASLAALFLALQFWTGFYQAWFFTLICGIVAGLFCLFHIDTIKRDWRKASYLIGSFVVTLAVLIFPLGRRYLLIKHLIGNRPWSDVVIYLPTWKAFLMPFTESSIYKDLLWEKFYPSFTHFSEMCMFSGFISLSAPLLFAISQYMKKSELGCEKILKIVAWSILIVTLLILHWGTSQNAPSLWKYVYGFVPGAGAVRVVARISLTMLLMSAVLLAYVLTVLQNHRSYWLKSLSALILIVFLIENLGSTKFAFKKSEHEQRISQVEASVSSRMPCSVFHLGFRGSYDPNRELDAMWASIRLNIPTSNGYTGSMPPQYSGDGVYMATGVEKIEAWLASNNRAIERNQICFLQ